jgi:hypothetical protein
VACGKAQACCGGKCVDTASFEDDVANCGSCGTACGSNQYCCQGDCLGGGVRSDGIDQLPGEDARCQCEKACGTASCCGTQCFDLTSDINNCGACGNKCKGLNLTCKNSTCKVLPILQ